MANGQRGKRSRTPLELYEREIVPAVFERPDAVMPEAGWKRVARGWQATNREFTKGRFGVRPDRVMVYADAPFGIQIHGRGFVTWVSFIAGQSKPAGQAFVDAVKELARRAGVDASCLDRRLTPEETKRAEERHRRQDCLETFLGIARAALVSDAPQAVRAREYLAGRGFTAEHTEALGYGLCPSAKDARRYLGAAGFAPEEIEKSGLTSDGRWPGRLVIPWRDRWGAAATLVARDVTGDSEDAQKYLYLRGGRKPEFYGLDRLHRALRDDRRRPQPRRPVAIVEGILDAETLRARGFASVLALGGDGTQLTAERWGTLASLGVRSAVLCLDFDPRPEPCGVHGRAYCLACSAGAQGTRAALDGLTGARTAPRVFVVDPVEIHRAAGGPKDEHGGPAKVDPDSLVRGRGLPAFEAVIGEAVPGPVYQGASLLAGITPESSHAEREQAVLDVAGHMERGLAGEWSKVHEDELVLLAAERTGWGAESLEPVFKAAEERARREAVEKGLDEALKGAAAARAEKADAVEVMQNLKGDLSAIHARTLDQPPPFSVDRLARESREAAAGKPSGWRTLDRLDVRFNPGEFAVVAGRTGHAKTSTLVGLYANWLEAEKASPCETLFPFYSLEEPELRVFHRLLALLAHEAGAPWTANEVRDYLRDPASRRSWPDPAALAHARERLRRWEDRILVVHRPAWTVDEIDAHVRHLAGTRELGAVVIDYLQRVVPPEGRYDRRDIEVSLIARRLKSLAVDAGVPVVAGAQINRQAVGQTKVPRGEYLDAKVQRALKALRPKLHHLREGGSEQEADLVLGLLNCRADYETDDDGEERNEAFTVPDVTRLDVGILKNRYGTPGRWASLAFEGRFHVIRDAEPGELQ